MAYSDHDFARVWPNVVHKPCGRMWPCSLGFSQHRPKPDKSKETLCPRCAKFGPKRSNSGPSVANIGPTTTELGEIWKIASRSAAAMPACGRHVSNAGSERLQKRNNLYNFTQHMRIHLRVNSCCVLFSHAACHPGARAIMLAFAHVAISSAYYAALVIKRSGVDVAPPPQVAQNFVLDAATPAASDLHSRAS